MDISALLTAGLEKLVGTTLSGIDGLVTSDEERGKLANVRAKLRNNAQVVGNDLAKTIEAEVSKRHASDMKSDSKLSKNIRPMALIFLTVMCVLYAFAVTFTTLTPIQIEASQVFAYPLFGLATTAYGFYFGGRSFEKGRAIIKEVSK